MAFCGQARTQSLQEAQAEGPGTGISYGFSCVKILRWHARAA